MAISQSILYLVTEKKIFQGFNGWEDKGEDFLKAL